MSQDQTLGETTPPQASQPGANPFTRPEPSSIDIEAHTPTLGRQLTVAEILERAKRPERRAHICLRADLQAQYDAILDELSTLVDANGELVVDEEASMADQSPAARAQNLNDQLEAVRRDMNGSMWSPLFRGISADDLAVFEKEYLPKGEGADLTPYHNQLIARTCVDPEMTAADVQQLRQTIGFKAFYSLVVTAREVCYGGGVDVPKSLNFSAQPKAT